MDFAEGGVVNLNKVLKIFSEILGIFWRALTVPFV